jgi:EAL domain-containing protein (putative c-di-GMP-specific phosphodiesterase class I)
LRAALERHEIEILFQPQFAASDDRLVGAEALARWQHPQRGLVGADALFAIAERAALVEPLTHHIVRSALGTAGNWPVPLRLSLNVTAADVAAGNFAANIASAVAKAGFPPEHLTLEITEQVLVAELDRTAERLRQLADLGIRIELDDFGAGFCNFHYLKRLPLHALKLDRSMIEGIVDDARDLAVLRGILAMARALGLEVVAEGVEREDQRAAIAREGCAVWQGFLGAKPMTAAEFAVLVGTSAAQ